MTILLGSSSPRRRQILSGLLPDFEIRTPDNPEHPIPGERPHDYAERISREKAQAIIRRLPPDQPPSLIITGDTIVTIDGLILGKPADFDDAIRSIRLLAGRTHQVITALTLAITPGRSRSEIVSRTDFETSAITFHPLADDEIRRYLESIEYRDKAGAYALQNGGSIVRSVQGSVTNVIGFPLRLFFRLCVEMEITEIFDFDKKIY